MGHEAPTCYFRLLPRLLSGRLGLHCELVTLLSQQGRVGVLLTLPLPLVLTLALPLALPLALALPLVGPVSRVGVGVGGEERGFVRALVSLTAAPYP